MIDPDEFEDKLKPKNAFNKAEGHKKKAKAPPKRHSNPALSNAEIAVRCLDYLAPWRASDYQDGAWLEVGMALHDAGASVNDWDQWSQQSSKYKAGECDRKWATFGKGNSRSIKVASLIRWASEDSGLQWNTLMQRVNPKSTGTLISEKPPLQPKPPRQKRLPWRPFPVDALPEPVRSFVKESAKAIVCDEAYLALPMLAGFASVIGNTRRIRLKRRWSEPAIVWTGIVGDSGTLKSPALEMALRPIRKAQHEAMKKHEAEKKQYESALLQWEKDMIDWKRRKLESSPPVKPEEPVVKRHWCDDVTIEALAVLLKQNPRGLLLLRDELSGWLGGFNRYSQGKGSDVAKWLEMHGGRSIIVDRKTGDSRNIYVPHATVSVTGGIQPSTLARSLSIEFRENGLAARLLFAHPPRKPKQWTEADVPSELEHRVSLIFERLSALSCDVDDAGDPKAVLLPLTGEGKEEWIRFYNDHAQEQSELSGDLSAAWSKLEGYAARFALIIHLVSQASGEFNIDTRDAIDKASVHAGVVISRWFGYEARRVYAMLSETKEDRTQRELIELIQRTGFVTVRLWHRMRSHPTADAARAELNGLVNRGFGHWESTKPDKRGGRPSEVFRLHPHSPDTSDTDRTQDNAGDR